MVKVYVLYFPFTSVVGYVRRYIYSKQANTSKISTLHANYETCDYFRAKQILACHRHIVVRMYALDHSGKCIVVVVTPTFLPS